MHAFLNCLPNGKTFPVFCLSFFLAAGIFGQKNPPGFFEAEDSLTEVPVKPQFCFVVEADVQIRDYFGWMDSVTARLSGVLGYDLTEHIWIRANPHVIETLENTDYYRIKAQTGSAFYDQTRLPALRAGDTLRVPDAGEAAWLWALQNRTVIDINIPEYKLRIIENGDTLFSFPVRVGRDTARFMQPVRRAVSLRTKTGQGKIEVLHREMVHIDPVSGEIFTHTRRDDGTTTLLPLIPWLEPRIGGLLHGQWTHPTTNPRTLGKAWSNGCIGTREADAWRIYYHAPVGTVVVVRYDLEVRDADGEVLRLPDIYPKPAPEPMEVLPAGTGETTEEVMGGGRR